MKQKFLLFILCSFVLMSCKNSYTIEGSIDPSLLELLPENTQLGLFKRVNKEWIKLDSTALADDGTFVFKGNIDEPTIAYVNTEDENLTQLVLEKGKITIEITEYGEIILDGTDNNRLLSEFNNALMNFISEEEAINYLHGFVSDNINNIVGYSTFSDYLVFFNMEQIDSIVGLMTDETKAKPVVVNAMEKIELMRRTSEGCPYLDIALLTPAGEELAISQLVGLTDFLLIDFWASWCGPCRRAMPAMIELYKNYNPTGKLEILGISLDDDNDAWINAINSLGLNWKHISDLNGWQSAAAKLYGVTAIPSTLLINKEGLIVARNLEPAQYADYLDGGK